MKRISVLLTLATALFSQSLFADGPCKPKGEAQHAARTALHACLDGWAKAKDTEPTDDCSTKLTAFVQASKDRFACHAEHKKSK